MSTNANIRSVLRPARVLVGWLPEDRAMKMLAHDPSLSDEQRAHAVRTAHAVVARRRPEVDQDGAILNPPASLTPYINELLAAPATEQLRKEGWVVRMANLRRLGCVQPSVFLDHAEGRARNLKHADAAALAKVTLPIEHASADFASAYDEAKNRFLLTSRNPNFRVVGAQQNNAPARGQPGIATGFVSLMAMSFMQVALYRGRYLLRDGYHRALGLLMNGVDTVPVFYRAFDEFDTVLQTPGFLPAKTFLGERSPLLIDYLDDEVAMTAAMPALLKVIIIQAIETQVFG